MWHFTNKNFIRLNIPDKKDSQTKLFLPKEFHNPSKFFSALQSYCFRLSVVLLSYDSRSTLIRRDGWEKFGRVSKSYTRQRVYEEVELSISSNFGISGDTTGHYQRTMWQWVQKTQTWLPVQDMFCNPVVLESISYRPTAKQMINERNTTGWLRKVWTGAEWARRSCYIKRAHCLMHAK